MMVSGCFWSASESSEPRAVEGSSPELTSNSSPVLLCEELLSCEELSCAELLGKLLVSLLSSRL
jgi:hypothetical protein